MVTTADRCFFIMDDCATSAKALDLYAGIFSGLEAATERGTNAFTRGIRLKASPGLKSATGTKDFEQGAGEFLSVTETSSGLLPWVDLREAQGALQIPPAGRDDKGRWVAQVGVVAGWEEDPPTISIFIPE